MDLDKRRSQIQGATSEILQRVPVIVLVSDAEASIIYANDSVETVLGYKPEEVLGRGWWRLTRPDPRDRHRAREFIRRAVTGVEIPSPDPYEEKITRRDGQTRYVLWRDVVGPNQTLIGVGQDITEQRRVEQRLREAKREAEQAAKLKTEFLANMSHEIRTPMNAVTGASSLLLDTSLDPKQKELVEVIRSSGLNLLGLVNDILDFSRIESGALGIEQRRLSLQDCVEDAVSAVSYQAASKGLDLGFRIAPSVPNKLVGDALRIRQILVNLLANAVKFTRTGWVFLDVEEGSNLADGRWELLFSVQDTGIGIHEDRLGHIFDAFSQADSSTSRRYGGTGLGLTISRRLCEMMGGRIWVETQVGKGSTFRFSILCATPRDETTDSFQTSGYFFNAILECSALVYGLPPASRRALIAWLELWQVKIIEPDADRVDDLDLEALGLDMAFLRIGRADRRSVRLMRALERASVPTLAVMQMTEELPARRRQRLSGQVIVPLRPNEIEGALRLAFGLAEPEPEEAEEVVELADLRILLGEDNPVNQMIALMMLENLGLEAEVAANGLEILKELQRKPYDVVLMDVQMPELDGLQTTRRIREELKSRVHIIAVTANAMEGDREQCLQAGMDDYISKPFQIEVLHRVLAQCRRLSDLGDPRSVRERTASDSPDSTELCPFITRCPMFPLFENEPIRRVYQLTYCKGDFQECHRYNLASEGTMPDPRLLPDGSMLPQPKSSTA